MQQLRTADSNVHCGKSLKSCTTGSDLTYPKCAIFADYLLGQEWLDDGVLTNQSMDWIQCESTHLTAFSVLLDPNIMPIPGEHRQVLSIISYIGSVCSIFGLFLTILTYSIFRWVALNLTIFSVFLTNHEHSCLNSVYRHFLNYAVSSYVISGLGNFKK
jgi:hypothetical protein